MSALPVILERLRATGGITVAEFMELALYHPEHGYYTTATRRSGRRGDFYTSVDVGPLFGELIANFVARVWHRGSFGAFDLVEAGAGDGRLMRDVLEALAREAPACHASARVGLVERSPAARAAQADTLGPHASRLAGSWSEVPAGLSGVLFANELLDAMPVHRVRVAPHGLEEAFVVLGDDGLALRFGPPSSPAVASYLDGLGLHPTVGTVADIGPAAIAWVRQACRAMSRGALLIVDYGHEAAELFGGTHAGGTLRSYGRHLVDAPGAPAVSSGPDAARRGASWLVEPGLRDLTAHVDFTAVRRAMSDDGFEVWPVIEQTRFLIVAGLGERLERAAGTSLEDVRVRLAAKALAVPGGMGSTHRALLATRGLALTPAAVGWPAR